MSALPKYSELPEAVGGARSGWFAFGADDQIGLMNLQTAQRVVDAAQLIRTGEVFSLDVPLDPSIRPCSVAVLLDTR